MDWTKFYGEMAKTATKGKKTNCKTNTCPAIKKYIESKHPYTRFDGTILKNGKKINNINMYQGLDSIDGNLDAIEGDAFYSNFEEEHPDIVKNFKGLHTNPKKDVEMWETDALTDAVTSITSSFFKFEGDMEKEVPSTKGKGGWDNDKFRKALEGSYKNDWGSYQTTSAYNTKKFHEYIEQSPATVSNVINGLPKLNFGVEISHPTEKTHGKIVYRDKDQVLFDNTKKVK